MILKNGSSESKGKCFSKDDWYWENSFLFLHAGIPLLTQLGQDLIQKHICIMNHCL